MATPRAIPGNLIDVRPLGPGLRSARSVTLVRTDHLEVVRLVLPAGKRIPEHREPGEVTVQCLEGALKLGTDAAVQTMHAGDLLFALPGQTHWLEALDDTALRRSTDCRQRRVTRESRSAGGRVFVSDALSGRQSSRRA
ncbi:cupin domain-containing protein [Paraburkholderia hospita]|uniref:cupin domain-containing protein n=1 Tax=Paraburkholderia hospita TaxID=169430 RepID=UPI000B3413AB|nr:cupin domain-containing protein [Paraburkholderia hospita]OUL96368.1 hypothetical protein CA601_02700 [Paraburkholderia hospita]